jgi:predicted deacetylase
MSARYVVRFDDFCPTMNWRVWDRLEPVLHRHGIKPIVAVVPDNQDPHLMVEAARADFWHRVRDWQHAGWTIALHGYQHLYETPNSGLMGINGFSEFAGLPEQTQRHKLTQALNIFRREGVRADAWVAPAHSFDATTVQLLLQSGIRVISDGFYGRALHHLGAIWIPQQVWRFRPLPLGLWTVCYHHNNFSESAIARFALDIAHYADRIIAVTDVTTNSRLPSKGWTDSAFCSAWTAALWLKQRRAAV